jgi:diguanylate cyclase (GGDEF)-like protein
LVNSKTTKARRGLTVRRVSLERPLKPITSIEALYETVRRIFRKHPLRQEFLLALKPFCEEFELRSIRVDQLTALILKLEARLREYETRISKIARYSESQVQKERLAAERKKLDPKTGFPWGSDFRQQAGRSLASERRSHVLVIVYFDVNHFKRINDEISHEMGDIVIARVARTLRSQMRSDLKAREGGDEFLAHIVLDHKEEHETYSEIALRIVERCCSEFENIDWTKYKDWKIAPSGTAGVPTIKPTLAAGVVIVHTGSFPRVKAGVPSGIRLAKRIIKIAEGLMKQSKHYEKDTNRRRVHFVVMAFSNLRLRHLAEGSHDSPAYRVPSR